MHNFWKFVAFVCPKRAAFITRCHQCSALALQNPVATKLAKHTLLIHNGNRFVIFATFQDALACKHYL